MVAEKSLNSADVYRRDDGIIVIHNHTGVKLTKADIEEQLEAVRKLDHGVQALVLVNSDHVVSMERGAREVIARSTIFSHAAIITNTSISRMIFNFVNLIQSSSSIKRAFTDEIEAVKWLLAQKKNSER